MPYLVLILGLLIGVFALYRFVIATDPQTVRIFLRACLMILYTGLMVFFAFAGRISIAIALLILALPFVLAYYRGKLRKKHLPPPEDTE